MLTAERPDLITQVSGPPCSGKSSWIAAHAQPEDRVLDDNVELAIPAGGRALITREQWKAWYRRLDWAVASHTGPGRLWIIRGNPAPLAAGITVQQMDCDRATCHARADADGRPPETHAWIDKWFTKYDRTAFAPSRNW